jgi:hypothetical protein
MDGFLVLGCSRETRFWSSLFHHQNPLNCSWVTDPDDDVAQALLSGNTVPATGRIRFQQILNLKAADLSGLGTQMARGKLLFKCYINATPGLAGG